MDTFRYMYKVLNNDMHIYAMDFPGFGESTIDRCYDLDDYVAFLKYFIETLSIKNYTLIAHSFGGRVAIKFLSESRNTAKGAILVDSAGIKHKKSLDTLTKIVCYKIRKNIYKLLNKTSKLATLYEISGSDDYRNSSLIMKDTMRAVIKEDLRKCLPKIDIDTLLIWGKEDKTTPYKDAKIMHKYLKKSAIITFDDSGHFPYLDNAKRFSLIVNGYINEIYKEGNF